MTRIRLRLPEIYPSTRLVIAFAVGAAWFFVVPWTGRLFVWLGIGYDLAVIALALIDYVWLADSSRCTVRRICEEVMSLGELNLVKIEIVHLGQRPLFLAIKDEPPVEFQTSPGLLTVRVDPGETAYTAYKTRPAERGDYHFGNVNIRFTTLLGLLIRQVSVPSGIIVKVYPDIFQTKKHLLLLRQNRVPQMGIRRSRLLGHGRDFSRLRDYLPDDSPRDIDWKATARKGSLIAREYDVEQSQTIMILLDIGRNMASRTVEPGGELGMTKLDCAINASVLLAHVATQSDDRIGLYCFAQNPVTYIPPGKGMPQVSRLLDALYSLRPRTEETAYYRHFSLTSHRQKKRSLVFLFTDLIDPESSKRLISSISLLARKHLVVCVALADYELPTIIESQPTSVKDLYTQTVALQITEARARALAELAGLGVITIDAVPSNLTVAAVNKYLQLKREGRL